MQMETNTKIKQRNVNNYIKNHGIGWALFNTLKTNNLIMFKLLIERGDLDPNVITNYINGYLNTKLDIVNDIYPLYASAYGKYYGHNPYVSLEQCINFNKDKKNQLIFLKNIPLSTYTISPKTASLPIDIVYPQNDFSNNIPLSTYTISPKMASLPTDIVYPKDDFSNNIIQEPSKPEKNPDDFVIDDAITINNRINAKEIDELLKGINIGEIFGGIPISRIKFACKLYDTMNMIADNYDTPIMKQIVKNTTAQFAQCILGDEQFLNLYK